MPYAEVYHALVVEALRRDKDVLGGASAVIAFDGTATPWSLFATSQVTLWVTRYSGRSGSAARELPGLDELKRLIRLLDRYGQACFDSAPEVLRPPSAGGSSPARLKTIVVQRAAPEGGACDTGATAYYPFGCVNQ